MSTASGLPKVQLTSTFTFTVRDLQRNSARGQRLLAGRRGRAAPDSHWPGPQEV